MPDVRNELNWIEGNLLLSIHFPAGFFNMTAKETNQIDFTCISRTPAVSSAVVVIYWHLAQWFMKKWMISCFYFCSLKDLILLSFLRTVIPCFRTEVQNLTPSHLTMYTSYSWENSKSCVNQIPQV